MKTFNLKYRNLQGEPEVNIYQEDNISGMYSQLENDSQHLVVTSIPFGQLFTYSGLPSDIGNNVDGVDLEQNQFALHMRFHLESLFRVVKPGCNVCIHIQQLLRYKNEHGYIGRRDFRGSLIEMMSKTGFEWKGEVVIPKNPQIIAQRLKLHSLMFATLKRNARDLAPAVNDYLMVFQKPGESEPVKAFKYRENPSGELVEDRENSQVTAEEWIRDAYGVWSNDDLKLKNRLESVRGLNHYFDENKSLSGFNELFDLNEITYFNDMLKASKELVNEFAEFLSSKYNKQNYENSLKFIIGNKWIIDGIWDDIRETDVLSGWRNGRSKEDEKHVCPLQLEVIRRCINLYTNVGENVLDPFNGIGSSTFVAIEMLRNAYGFELKESYFDQSVVNMEILKNKSCQMELF